MSEWIWSTTEFSAKNGRAKLTNKVQGLDSHSDYAVRIRGIVKSFGRTRVLRGIDLDVPWGQTLSLVGANGSGKTTLLKILATLSKPDSGQIVVAGLRPDRSGATLRKQIGVVTHDPLLYDDLTARENLRFYCRMFDVPDADERVESVADMVGMESRLDQRIGSMSHGMKKRFSIARALLHDPPILLMDEPESGLDYEAVNLLDKIISERSDPYRAIIMTTHDLNRAIRLGDSLAVLSAGQVSYSGDAKSETASDAYLGPPESDA